jgi:hypothetical protein
MYEGIAPQVNLALPTPKLTHSKPLATLKRFARPDHLPRLCSSRIAFGAVAFEPFVP